MIRRDFERLANRVDDIDRNGTRAAGVVAAQIGDLGKDLAELKGENRTWQQAHELAHTTDKQERDAGRRFLVNTGIALVVALVAVVGLLVTILTQLR